MAPSWGHTLSNSLPLFSWATNLPAPSRTCYTISIGSVHTGIWASDWGFHVSIFKDEAPVWMDTCRARQAFWCSNPWVGPWCVWIPHTLAVICHTLMPVKLPFNRVSTYCNFGWVANNLTDFKGQLLFFQCNICFGPCMEAGREGEKTT